MDTPPADPKPGIIVPPPPEQRRSLFEASAREAHSYKWIESEKAHRDLGDRAIADWYKQYWWIFCRERFIEHLMGECFWEELDADDYGMLTYRFPKDDPLVAGIVEIFRKGGENLDVVNYAIDNGLDMEDVLSCLQTIDINARRLAPTVAITEKQFVDSIHAKHHPRGLVVDPDGGVCDFIRHLMEARGIECVAANTGEQAMEEAQSRQFDVFFIELTLPDKQGAEVAWFMRRHGVNDRVVAMAPAEELARWSEDDLADCGFSLVIPKPLDQGRVEAALAPVAAT